MFQVHCSGTKSKFRTHNNGWLQQVWTSSIGKSTVEEFRKKWGFKVLGLEKRGFLAAEKKSNRRNFFMFQVHCSGRKSSVLTILAGFSKFGPIVLENLFYTNLEKKGFYGLRVRKKGTFGC